MQLPKKKQSQQDHVDDRIAKSSRMQLKQKKTCTTLVGLLYSIVGFLCWLSK